MTFAEKSCIILYNHIFISGIAFPPCLYYKRKSKKSRSRKVTLKLYGSFHFGGVLSEELVFSTVIQELKNSWGEQVAIPDLINLLYDAIANPIGLMNKKGDPITVSKGTASKIVNREANPNLAIRKHSTDKPVLDSIVDFFKTNIVTRLLKSSEENLIFRLREVITNDNIANEKRNELLALAQKSTLAEFLASVYLYSLSRKNAIKLDESAMPITHSENEERKRHPLPVEKLPTNLNNEERPYVEALMDVYAEMTGITNFTLDILDTYPFQKEHFVRQRTDYFAAEAVRRGTRDVYGDDEEEEYFEIFLKEIKDGIIDVYSSPRFAKGYDRLEAVLIEAKNTPVNQCWLSRDTVWIGNSQKKGACHILINKKILKRWIQSSAKTI